MVHTEIDWHGPLGFGDTAALDVTVIDVGRSSFTLGFAVSCDGRVVAAVRTVYVCVATDGSGPRPVPRALRARLTEPA